MAEDDPYMRAWVHRVLTGHDVSVQTETSRADRYMPVWARRVLSRHEISVHEVTSGIDLLLGLMSMPQVDLVISDMRMPLLDGLEALALVRRVGMDLPFLLITAFGDRDLRRSVGELDAWLLDKPFSAQELLACVAALASGVDGGSAGPAAPGENG